MEQAASDRLRFDHRWIISKRPIVMTGGELTLETLDLIYDETSKFYEGPFQMKANGGVFFVGDLRRPTGSPQELPQPRNVPPRQPPASPHPAPTQKNLSTSRTAH